jgi:predicted permease
VVAQLVSGNWFATLGVRAARGRLNGEADQRTMGGHPVAVISDRFWQSRFGGDPAVVGRTIRLSGAPLTVIGVSQPGFSGLTVGVSVDVWVPLAMQSEVRYRSNVASENNSDIDKPWIPQADITWLTLVMRGPPSANRQIAARLDPPFRAALGEQFANRDSAARAYGMREHIVLDPIPRGLSSLRGQFSDPLRILLASVGLILLIACGNLAGLLLARSAARNREFAVRVSLGASPGRLVRQILTESILLSVIGGLLSLAVARWGTSALLVLASSGAQAIPLTVKLDARVLGFAFAISIATGVVFGLAPALRAARTDLYDSFKAGGRVVSAASTHRLPLGRALVMSQLALSLVLVASAALFIQTFRNLVDIDPGYDRDRVLEARLDLRAAGYTSDLLPGLNQRPECERRVCPCTGWREACDA